MAEIDKSELPYLAYQGQELAGLMRNPKCFEHNNLTIQVIERFGMLWGRVAFIAYIVGWEEEEMNFPFELEFKNLGILKAGDGGRRMLDALFNNLKTGGPDYVCRKIVEEVDAWDADQIEEYYRYMRKKQLERDSIW